METVFNLLILLLGCFVIATMILTKNFDGLFWVLVSMKYAIEKVSRDNY